MCILWTVEISNDSPIGRPISRLGTPAVTILGLNQSDPLWGGFSLAGVCQLRWELQSSGDTSRSRDHGVGLPAGRGVQITAVAPPECG